MTTLLQQLGSLIGEGASKLRRAVGPRLKRATTDADGRSWPNGSSVAILIGGVIWVMLKMALVAVLIALGWWMLPIGLFYLIGKWWQRRLKRRELRWAERIRASRARV